MTRRAVTNQTTRIDSDVVERFATCCLALGLTVRGRRRLADLAAAHDGFASLAHVAHDQCDIWVGLTAAGDRSPATLAAAVASKGSWGVLSHEVGLAPGSLRLRYDSGLYLELNAADQAGLSLAHAASTAAEGKLARAYSIAEQVLKSRPDWFDARWSAAAIAYRGERWPDVVSLLAPWVRAADPGVGTGPDAPSAHAARITLGLALSRLGMFAPALAYLDDSSGPVAVAAEDGALAKALCLRALGDERGALDSLHALYAHNPGDEQLAAALADESFGIATTTAAKIAARSDPWDPATEPDSHSDPATAARKAALLVEAEDELAAFVGLDEVKNQVARLKSSAAMGMRRESRGLTVAGRAHHLVFAGPPGTGKTTIARVVAKIYCGLGFLRHENIKEVHRSDLVGQHIGETEAKTNAVIDAALDGVLFIDEAYSLVSTGAKNDFGLVAIDTLLARMENDRDRLVAIIAGYPQELDMFLSANEGLRSRFTRTIRFPSYTPAELVQIADALARSRDTRFDPPARSELESVLSRLSTHTALDQSGSPRPAIDVAGNGRFVRNLVERAEEEREHRLEQGESPDDLTEDELMTITSDDIRHAERVLLQGLGFDAHADRRQDQHA